MDTKTDIALIASFSAVIASLLNISSNALSGWFKNRRQRGVILNKSLMSLIEIRTIVQAAYRARSLNDGIEMRDTTPLGKVVHYKSLQVLASVIYDGSLPQRNNIYKKFQDLLQDVSGEDPFLAVQLSNSDSFLHKLDIMQRKWGARKAEIDLDLGDDPLLSELLKEEGPELPNLKEIASALLALDNSILRLGDLCDRKIRSQCKKYIEERKKEYATALTKESLPLVHDALEKINARREFARDYAASRGRKKSNEGDETQDETPAA